MALEIEVLEALSDNYVYLCRDLKRSVSFVVDPSQASPVINALEAHEDQWQNRLDYILCTHHHADHIGGVEELKKCYGAEVIGSKKDAHRLPWLDHPIDPSGEGEDFFASQGLAERLGFQMIDCPGHTLGGVTYYFAAAQALFSGDTLFLSGCGRLFEGTPVQLYESLRRLARLPVQTQIYAGHEYSLKNTEFALRLQPHEPLLQKKWERIRQLRLDGQSTMPGTLEEELLTNPFLRCEQPALQKAVGVKTAHERAAERGALEPSHDELYSAALECFVSLRQRRDVF